MPVVEFEVGIRPGWSVVSEVISEVGQLATVFSTFNFRNDSPSDVVLEQPPRAVGPTNIGVHLYGYWIRLC